MKIGHLLKMKVGSLVVIPSWQKGRHYWEDFKSRGVGVVFEITPYAVHVRWSNGEELAHNKFGVARHFEVRA